MCFLNYISSHTTYKTPCVFKLYLVPYHPLCFLICAFSYASSSSLSHNTNRFRSASPRDRALQASTMFFPQFLTFEYTRGPWHHWCVLGLRLDFKPQVSCTCPVSLIYFWLSFRSLCSLWAQALSSTLGGTGPGNSNRTLCA